MPFALRLVGADPSQIWRESLVVGGAHHREGAEGGLVLTHPKGENWRRGALSGPGGAAIPRRAEGEGREWGRAQQGLAEEGLKPLAEFICSSSCRPGASIKSWMFPDWASQERRYCVFMLNTNR